MDKLDKDLVYVLSYLGIGGVPVEDEYDNYEEMIEVAINAEDCGAHQVRISSNCLNCGSEWYFELGQLKDKDTIKCIECMKEFKI